MKTYVSLLRGINVSGQNKIRMHDLKQLYESLNLENLAVYLQSGNVVFDSPEKDPFLLARSIEAGITQSFGLSVQVLLRDKYSFMKIKEGNPFITNRNVDLEKLHITFLFQMAPESTISNLLSTSDTQQTRKNNKDEFLIIEREVYLLCQNGYGRIKLSNNFFERKLKVSATTRNWKTVSALYEILKQREA
jgi:uncharacterized protein (DUF1697 family)